jgi:hypothetical protein
MSDLTITIETVTKGKRVACRYKWLDPCKKSGAKNHGDFMKEDTKYIAIRGWAAGGAVTIGICEYHAEEFFEQISKAKRELKKK